MKRDELLRMGRRELAAVLAAGHPVEMEALADFEFRGIALGLPRFVERLSWKTFKKVFCRDPATGALRGWNVRIVQAWQGGHGGVDGPYEPQRRRDGEPRTFGHYAVLPLDGYRVPRACGPGLMLDYGRGGNGALDPLRLMRDPLVAVNAGNAELLLGWSYVELGFARLGTPSFFTLERDVPLTHRHAPPSAPHPVGP